jgi:hypothetical protein
MSHALSRYLNAIQTMCPHILRYLTTAVITNKGRRQKVLKDLVKVIQQVSFKMIHVLCFEVRIGHKTDILHSSPESD